MTRLAKLRIGAALAALAGILWTANPVFAPPVPLAQAEGVLSVIPGDAPIVIHLRGIERIKERINALVKNAAPDFAPVAQGAIDEMLKDALEDRSIRSVAPDGPIFVFFTEMPRPDADMPVPCFAIKVDKYEDFRDGFFTEDERKGLKVDPAGFEIIDAGKVGSLCLINKQGFALITNKKESAQVLVRQQQNTLGAKLSRETARKLLDADISVYVDMAAVNKEFAEAIKQGRGMVGEMLEMGAGELDKRTIELVKSMADGVFQMVADAREIVLTGDLRPEGLHVHLSFGVQAGSKTSDALKTFRSVPLQELGSLPRGRAEYTAVVLETELFRELAPLINATLMGGEGIADLLKKVVEMHAEAGPQTSFAAADLHGGKLTVTRYKNPARAVEASLHLYDGLKKADEFMMLPLKEKPELRKDAQRHRGFTLHSIAMVPDYEKLAEQPEWREAVDLFKKMFGEKISGWFGTDGKVVLDVSAKDWESARAIIDDYLDGRNTIGTLPTFQEARKHLPANAAYVTIMDLPATLQTSLDLVAPMLQAQGLQFEMPKVQLERGKAFMGVAIATHPEHLSIDYWLPASSVPEIRKLIEPLFGDGPRK